jgi:hypothetical protein
LKPRRLGWASLVAITVEMRYEKKQSFSENVKGRDHLKDFGVDGKIILK